MGVERASLRLRDVLEQLRTEPEYVLVSQSHADPRIPDVRVEVECHIYGDKVSSASARDYESACDAAAEVAIKLLKQAQEDQIFDLGDRIIAQDPKLEIEWPPMSIYKSFRICNLSLKTLLITWL